MGIKDLIVGFMRKDKMFVEAQNEDRIREKIVERKKSSNERELERFMKEERETEIKEQLEKFRKRRNKEIEFGHQILRTKNMFANDKPKILKQKNLFTGKGEIIK